MLILEKSRGKIASHGTVGNIIVAVGRLRASEKHLISKNKK